MKANAHVPKSKNPSLQPILN